MTDYAPDSPFEMVDHQNESKMVNSAVINLKMNNRFALNNKNKQSQG